MTTATLAEPAASHEDAIRTDALSRILNIDFAAPLAFLALAIVYAASRAPFLNDGFGTDPDAWRVALSGYWLWDHHEFYPSRLPGYPVHELASAAVIKGGWTATNGLTALVSLGGLWFFAAIARKLELPNRAVIVVAYAFTPLLWINSMTTMDYMWALSFILGAYYMLLSEEPLWAGLLLGLAAGSRLPSLVFLVPFVVYLVRQDRTDEIRDLVTWALFVPVVAYSLILWKYGFYFLNFYDTSVGYLNVLRLLGKDTLGLLGTVAVLAAIALSLPRLARLPRDFIRDANVMFWVLAIAIGIAVFLRLPHEAAYLLPVYPFGFFLMSRYFHRLVLVGAVAIVVLAGFVDLTSPGDEITMEAFTNAQLGKGLILSNSETIDLQADFVADLEKQEYQPGSYVSLGFIYPQYVVRNRDELKIGILEKDRDAISQLSDRGQAVDQARNLTFVWLLDWETFEELRGRNTPFAHTLDAGRSTAGLYDYRPALFGSVPIDLGRGPSGGSGAARTDR